MGSKSSALCCQKTTSAVIYIFEKSGYLGLNYLDDLGSAETEEKAENAFAKLGDILEKIGIKESKKKAQPPAKIATFLGVLFNTILVIMCITPDRLRETEELVKSWLRKSSATLNELQQLLGKLNFLCSTVRAGRVFMTRIIEDIKKWPYRGRRRITNELKKDLSWWGKFLRECDGISIIPNTRWSRPDAIFSSDACLSSCGGWNETNEEYFYTAFPDSLKNNKEISINELETISLIICLKIWSTSIENRNLLAFCDNQTTVEIVNTGQAKNRIAQQCLREICWITAKNNAVIKVIFKQGVQNRTEDFLSQIPLDSNNLKKFHEETKSNRNKRRIVITNEMFKFSHER